MNSAVVELYYLLLVKKWVVVDTGQEGSVRIVMTSSRKRAALGTSIISRAGQKIRPTHSYPTKIFWFNTLDGNAMAITTTDMDNMDYVGLLDSLAANSIETDNAIVSTEVLL